MHAFTPDGSLVTRSVKTGQDGTFVIRGLNTGSYRIAVLPRGSGWDDAWYYTGSSGTLSQTANDAQPVTTTLGNAQTLPQALVMGYHAVVQVRAVPGQGRGVDR